MKRLVDFAGGRNLVNDDLSAIQDSLDQLMAIYQATGPFVVRGLQFTLNSGSTYDVSAGAVMLNNRLIEFPAQQIILNATKAIAEANVLDVDVRQYSGLSVTKAGNKQYGIAITSGTSPSQPGDNLFVTTPSGSFKPQVRRLQHALQELTFIPGMVIPVTNNIVAKFSGSFDPQGRDEWFGWRLRSADPGPTGAIDLRNNLIIGAGGAYNVGDDTDFNVTTGPTLIARATALHLVEFVGTRSSATTFV